MNLRALESEAAHALASGAPILFLLVRQLLAMSNRRQIEEERRQINGKRV